VTDGQDWQPTRHHGLRRTRVAQVESAAQIKRRTVGRNHPWVLKMTWNERLGVPSCPYVIRWSVQARFGSVRLHHWLDHDDDRAFHDHPWWFITLVLRGGYTDRSPDGDDHLHAGSVRFREARHRHTVFPDAGGCWTVVVTGRRAVPWGFWLNGKFRKANKWFAEYGHHPCS
jgi:hypothetical protein